MGLGTAALALSLGRVEPRELLSLYEPHPKLVVFDLDFTLWDCGGLWCDCLTPPFKREGTRVLDADNRHVRFFPDVLEILDALDDAGCCTALASRTEQPEWARELLRYLEAHERFLFQEIFPGCKVAHFDNLKRSTGFEYEDMLFFDDEHRNIAEVGDLGVTAIHVMEGINRDVFALGLQEHSKRNSY